MEPGWDDERDVVVVGSGAGALTGAYLAARRGLDTAVLEKTTLLGGTSAYSGGACWLPGTAAQQRAGLTDDSTDSARSYLQALLGGENAERREAFLAHAPALVHELEQDPHLPFEWRPFPEYFEAPGRVPPGRSLTPCDLPRDEIGELADLIRPAVDRDRAGKGHRDGPLTGGGALIGRLLLSLMRTGRATVRTRHTMRSLVVAHGRVVGVEAEHEGRKVRIGARRGVLLAAGGFERDQLLRNEHGVPGQALWSMAPDDSNVGEPLLAAIDVGAAIELMDEAWWCPGLALPGGRAGFTLGLRGGLIVDTSGRRYANESLPYDRMGRAMAANPAAIPSYLVFDSSSGGHLPAIAMPGGRPSDHLAERTWTCAATVAALAEQIGVPAQALVATVEQFNADARTGVDREFRRGEDPYDLFFATGQGPNAALVPLDSPPYYAATLVLSDLGTKGGLSTDARGRVLSTDGSPIEGLYAVGNTAASMTGRVYPAPGAPIGTAMVFASLAVLDMAESGRRR